MLLLVCFVCIYNFLLFVAVLSVTRSSHHILCLLYHFLFLLFCRIVVVVLFGFSRHWRTTFIRVHMNPHSNNDHQISELLFCFPFLFYIIFQNLPFHHLSLIRFDSVHGIVSATQQTHFTETTRLGSGEDALVRTNGTRCIFMFFSVRNQPANWVGRTILLVFYYEWLRNGCMGKKSVRSAVVYSQILHAIP